MADEELPEWMQRAARRKERSDRAAEREAKAAARETKRRRSAAGKARYEREQLFGGPAASLQCEGSACKNKESESTHLLTVASQNDFGERRLDHAVLCPNCAKKSQELIDKNFGRARIDTLTPENKEIYFNYISEPIGKEDTSVRQFALPETIPGESAKDRQKRLDEEAQFSSMSLPKEKSDIEVQIPQPSFDETMFARASKDREGNDRGISTFEPPTGARNTEYKVTETGLKPWKISQEPYANPGNMYTSLRNGVLHYHMAREGRPDITFVDLGSALANKPGVAAALMARHKQTVFEERNHPLHKALVLHKALEKLKGTVHLFGTDQEPAGLVGRITATPMPARTYTPRSLRNENFSVDDDGESTNTTRPRRWNWHDGTKGISCQNCDSMSRPIVSEVKDHKGRILSDRDAAYALDQSKILNSLPKESLSSEDLEDMENYKKHTFTWKCPDCDAPRSPEMDKAYSSASPSQRENITRILSDASKLTKPQFEEILKAHREETIKDIVAGAAEEADTGKVTPGRRNFGGPTMLPVPELGPEEREAREAVLETRRRSKTPPMDATDPRRILQEADDHLFCEDCEKVISKKNVDRHIQMHSDLEDQLNAAEESAKSKARQIDVTDVASSGLGVNEPKKTVPTGNPFAKSRPIEDMDWYKKPENG